MTDNNHPITPPDELRWQWIIQSRRQDYSSSTSADYVAIQAAQWGYEQRGADNEEKLQKVRDEELDACVEWLAFPEDKEKLRADRRPKPPTLGEQAQRILVENGTTIDGRMELDPDDIDTIRAALERLRELEALDG